MVLYHSVDFILSVLRYFITVSILYCQCCDTLSQCRFYTVNVMILFRSIDFILSVLRYLSKCRFYSVSFMILYRSVEFILSML